MQINNDGVLVICAVRYALGRQSYMPKMVIDEITPLLPKLSDRNLTCMAKDISEYLQIPNIKKDLDYKNWNKLYHYIIEEQVRRVGRIND